MCVGGGGSGGVDEGGWVKRAEQHRSVQKRVGALAGASPRLKYQFVKCNLSTAPPCGLVVEDNALCVFFFILQLHHRT